MPNSKYSLIKCSINIFFDIFFEKLVWKCEVLHVILSFFRKNSSPSLGLKNWKEKHIYFVCYVSSSQTMAPHHALGTMGKPSMSEGETRWSTMQELFNIEQFCPKIFKKSKLINLEKLGEFLVLFLESFWWIGFIKGDSINFRPKVGKY